MMKLITFKPIAFLLKLSVSNLFSNKIEEFKLVVSTNKQISLLEVIIVALKSQQKSVGFFISQKRGPQFKNNIFYNILVGKDESVVTAGEVIVPTTIALQL